MGCDEDIDAEARRIPENKSGHFARVVNTEKLHIRNSLYRVNLAGFRRRFTPT
jgi:hypothetical protein